MPVQKLLAKIHIAKKELALDDETYRQALQNLTGKRSAADLSNEQILKCIRHFKDLGWHPSTGSGCKKYNDQKGDIYSATPAQKRKVEVLWHNIYQGNSETKHLRQFLFNHFKVSDLRFLTKDLAYQVIEALKSIQNRRTRDTVTDTEINHAVL
jgi:hypothetical protein